MAIHGKDAHFTYSSQDLSAHLTSIDFSQQNDSHDNTTFGDEGHEFVGGLTNGTITLNGFWDDTATTGSATVLDALVGSDSPVAFEFGPAGNGSGEVKYSGSALLTSLDYSDPVADLVTFTASLQISGSVTKGTFT